MKYEFFSIYLKRHDGSCKVEWEDVEVETLKIIARNLN